MGAWSLTPLLPVICVLWRQKSPRWNCALGASWQRDAFASASFVPSMERPWQLDCLVHIPHASSTSQGPPPQGVHLGNGCDDCTFLMGLGQAGGPYGLSAQVGAGLLPPPVKGRVLDLLPAEPGTGWGLPSGSGLLGTPSCFFVFVKAP